MQTEITFEQSLLSIEDHLRKGFGINFAIKTILDYTPSWLDDDACEAMYSFAIALAYILEYQKQQPIQLSIFDESKITTHQS